LPEEHCALGARTAPALNESSFVHRKRAGGQHPGLDNHVFGCTQAYRQVEGRAAIVDLLLLSHYESWVISARCGTVAIEIFFAARSRGEGAALSRNLQRSTSTRKPC